MSKDFRVLLFQFGNIPIWSPKWATAWLDKILGPKWVRAEILTARQLNEEFEAIHKAAIRQHIEFERAMKERR